MKKRPIRIYNCEAMSILSNFDRIRGRSEMFIVLTAYYKHGEADVEIYDRGEIVEFLREKLQRYGIDPDDEEHEDDEDEKLESLLIKTVKYGQKNVREQNGWGVLKIIEIADDGHRFVYN